jgi:hypothetical protein
VGVRVHVANEDQEKLGDLPPLDILPDEGEGPADEQLPDLIDPNPEEEDPEGDEGIDVDVGIDLMREDAAEDDRPEIVLDIAELLAVADERESEEDPHSMGPDSTLADDIDPEGEARELLGSSEEGVDEPVEDLVADELPELDADEPGGMDDAFSSEIVTHDDELPPRAAEAWAFAVVSDVGTALTSVHVGPDAIVAGGHGVVWISGADVHIASMGGAHVRAVAPLEDGSVLCATSAGELCKVTRGAQHPEGVPGVLIALGARPGRAHQLACATFPEAGPRGALAHAGGTSIATTRDAGETWQALEIGGRIVAMTSGGAPTRVVARGHEGFGLLVFDGTGRTLSRIALDDRVAEEILAHDSTLIAAMPGYLALASKDGDLALSRDGGKSFERIDGCQRATALAAGIREGRPRVWLTTFQEALERVVVIEVDVETGRAECIAELRTETTADSLDPSVTALCFDLPADLLWCAGDAGLSRLIPPSRRELADVTVA